MPKQDPDGLTEFDFFVITLLLVALVIFLLWIGAGLG